MKETKSERNTRIIKSHIQHIKSCNVENATLVSQALDIANQLNDSDLQYPRDLSPEGYRSLHRQLVSYLTILKSITDQSVRNTVSTK